MNKREPLASVMRPKTLEDFIGQRHIMEGNSMLRRTIKADILQSMILYGPPGTGKTSLARVIAETTMADFQSVNATVSGKKDMEKVVAGAQKLWDEEMRATILFVDEIHRFNKAQQDYLLPFVEDGTMCLIGATTENPYFEVNNALVSRSTVFELRPLSKEDVEILLKKVLDDEKFLEDYAGARVKYDPDAVSFLAEMAAGDARRAYNALEMALLTTEPVQGDPNYDPDSEGEPVIELTMDVAKECIQKKGMRYDKDGDFHYDTISAFIKSMRGSDPDAVLYYLARMLASGEDIKFIARRIMIHAAEDVGLADPMALCVAASASIAIERIGMPEAQIILAEAALYIANAPKSNSSAASISRAMELVKFAGDLPIPAHLQDAHYKSSAKLNRGIGYKYPHDCPGAWAAQQYLPDALHGAGVELFMRTENDPEGFGGNPVKVRHAPADADNG